jgi:hypothetical protein
MTDSITAAIQAEKARRSAAVPDLITDAVKAERASRSARPADPSWIDRVGNVASSMASELSAAWQGASTVTRDRDGNSTMPIAGEFVRLDSGPSYKTPDGQFGRIDPTRHVVLRDDGSGKVMVYNRTEDPNTISSRLESAGRMLSLGALSPVTKSVTTAALGGPSKAARNLADLDRAGIRPPSLGTVTEGRGTRIIEEVGRNNPVTAGAFQKAENRAVADAADATERMAARFGGAEDPYSIGETVRTGIEKYGEKLSQVGERLFDPVHNAIGKETKVDIGSTRQFLDAEAARFAEYPSLDSLVNSPKLKSVQKALSDTGELPYEILKELRSSVGKRLSSVGLRDDTETSLLKGLYASLTDDMKLAATNAGVLDKFNRANSVWSREMGRVTTLNKLYGKAQERIASDVEAMVKGGTSRTSYEAVKTLFGALKGPDRSEVASGLLRTMGRSKANDPDSFSPTQFLTAFSKMDDRTKNLLFGGPNRALRKDLNSLARAMGVLDRAGDVKQRPNTAIPLSGSATLGALAGGAYVAPEMTALATLSGVAAAQLLTNSRFIRLIRLAAENNTRIPAAKFSLLVRDMPQQASAIRAYQNALSEQNKGE